MSELISNDKVKAHQFPMQLNILLILVPKMIGVYSMMITKTSIPLNYNQKLNTQVPMPLC